MGSRRIQAEDVKLLGHVAGLRKLINEATVQWYTPNLQTDVLMKQMVNRW